VSIVGIDFEPSLRGRVPAVEDGPDLEAAVTAAEGKRLLFGAVAGVALDTDRHRAMVLSISDVYRPPASRVKFRRHSMSAARFLMILGAATPVAPFSHAVEVDGWMVLTGQMPTDPNDDAAPLPAGVEA
jgi:enamine deaminase RidA (YjgF/YER057c/UK114 family)